MNCPHCKQMIVTLKEEPINRKVSAYYCPECEFVVGLGPIEDIQ